MQLFEGAKVSQQILRQAINDPAFTFGIEAEFYLKGAAEFMTQYMTQGLDTATHGDSEYYVKKLGDIEWHDVTHFFEPLGVHQGDKGRHYDIIQRRMESLYKQQMEVEPLHGTPDVMWDELKEEYGVHVIMAALRIYPDGRIIGLPENQEKVLRDIIYDGDTEEIKPFGKLRDLSVAMAPVAPLQSLPGRNDLMFYNMFRDETVSAFYGLVAKDLSKKLGTTVQYVFDDHLVFHVGGYESWVITTDTSLAEEMEDAHAEGIDIMGIELVSPIMNAEEGLSMLQKVLEVLNGEILGLDVVTTSETGLHINLGVKNKEIDPVKILVLSGDEHMTQKFDRANNKYAASIQSAMKDRMSTVAAGDVPRGMSNTGLRGSTPLIAQAQEVLKGLETDERDIDRVIAVLNNIKPEGKSHSINFEKLPSGYVEYRAIGNAGYEKRKGEIMDAVLHMIGMTYIATEPSVYRKEFLKKLYSMVQSTMAQTDVPIAASVGMIGYGPRGGYGAPIEKEEPTPYDGENFMTKFGFDSGSDTQ